MLRRKASSFVWLTAPSGFTGDEIVEGVIAHKVHLGIADASGRQSPVVIEDSQYTLPADLVILALGFDPDNIPQSVRGTGACRQPLGHDQGRLQDDDDLDRRRVRGWVTSCRGASLVVWAIKDGRDRRGLDRTLP